MAATNLARALQWLFGLMLAAVLAACGGGGDPAGTSLAEAANKATCSYQHVYVTVLQVRVRQEVDGNERWNEIALPAPQRIDLMNLSGGVLQSLGAALLAPGHYTEVRLILAGNDGGMAHAVQPTGGNLAPLTVPSATESGLKLKGNFMVPADQTGDIVLQGFDPCDAVVQMGTRNAPRYQLKPELAASVQLVAPVPPETKLGPGTVLPVMGGGYVLQRVISSNVWELQRYGADGQRVGSQVTIRIAGEPVVPAFAPLTGGGYAALWLTRLGSWQGSDTFFHSAYQIYSQSFTAAGAPIGSPVPIATTDPGAVSRPAAVPQLAALANGGFVVVWGLQRSFGSDVFDTGVYSQRFTAEGAAVGSVQQAVPEGGSGFLDVTGLTKGGYLVTWGSLTSPEGGARAYSASGEPLGPPQPAGSNWAPAGMTHPRGDLAALAGGGAVTVWQYPREPMRLQQLAPDATRFAEGIVKPGAAPPFSYVAVAGLPDGGYVVAWTVGGDIYARRYAADAMPKTEPVRINVVTISAGSEPSVVAMAGGGFMITWTVTDAFGVRYTYGRLFPTTGLSSPP